MSRARLHTGELVDTTDDAWWRECEAYAILQLPDKSARHAQLAVLEKRRGLMERERAESLILSLWRWERAAA